MNDSLVRQYLNEDGKINGDASFFVGVEVEQTAQYGEKTLFVVGIQDVNEITMFANQHDLNHIYLGANKSFNPTDDWEPLIDQLLSEGYWVTIDYPVRSHNFVMRILQNHMRNSRLIPMISVELPNIEIYNYNTTLKIDDLDINHSNPGVWCWQLHELMDRDKFTDWDCYVHDEVIK